MKLDIFAWLLRRATLSAFEDNCFSIAKGAAYSALLSFFPILTSAATILVQTRAQFFSDMLVRSLSEVVPPGTEYLVVQQFRVSGARPIGLLVAAGFISLWAASSVIKSLIEGFHAAYRVPRNRSFVHGSAVAMALVLLSAVPLLCASALILFGGQVEHTLFRWVGANSLDRFSWFWDLMGRLTRYAVAFVTMVVVTCCLYYFGPYRRQQLRFVWPGASVATVMWLLATSGFAWYVRNIGHYNVLYGSVGAVLALLVWMYLLAAIAMIGCEFNAVLERSARAKGTA